MKTPHHKIYNRWIYLSREEQRRWLWRAYERYFHRPIEFKIRRLQQRQKEVVEIDGTHIKSPEAFFCAMGEAANGPRGYFGQGEHGFIDCAWGGFGLVRGFRLRWKNHHTSKQHLDSKMLVVWISTQIKQRDYPDEAGLAWLINHKKEAEDGYTMYQEILDWLHHSKAIVEER